MVAAAGRGSVRRLLGLLAAFALVGSTISVATLAVAPAADAADPIVGPLHTTGTDSVIYDAANNPVRLVGFNWSGTDVGGRADNQKTADVCGWTWRTPADSLNGLTITYDDAYTTIKSLGYNTIRLPISWNNLEPVAPVWDAANNVYVHSWNPNYLGDLKSMVSKARAAGLMVILDMHQDYWSPALHHITQWDGSPGYCEGIGMPRWLDPTADRKAATTQNTDFHDSMNWFYRNLQDPLSTTTQATPWQLLYAAWDELATQFSPANFPDASTVIGADLLNEPYWSYVGDNPLPGQTVLQTAGTRLKSFYEYIAPAVTSRNPSWLLFFQDCSGGYNAANPSVREAPVMTGRPNVLGNWVYSYHAYDFNYGTFSDGVVRHDDFGITMANVMLANAQAWKVPLYIGEFTNFSLGIDARQLTAADMAQTKAFLSWAKQNQVSWTFWAYMNPWWPMAFLNYLTDQPIPVVRDALATGLDTGPPPTPTTPGAPSALTVVAGDGRLALSWSAPASDGGSPITDYVIQDRVSGTSTWQTVADGVSTAPSATITGLANGTGYDIQVAAVNAVGQGPYSATATATPQVGPTNLLPDPGFEVGNGGWAPFIVGSLTRVGSPTHGGSFALQVAAVSAGVNYVGLTQNSVVSRSVAGTTYTASCWVQPTRGTLNVQFRFLEYTQNWGSYIPVSTTTVNNVPTGSWTLVQVSGKAVNSGERMIPQIYSTNQTTNTGAMLYDDCSVTAGGGQPATVPSAPLAVTATAGDQSAVVSFSAPADTGGSPVTSYTVTSVPDGVVATGAASPITVRGLRNGTAYTFTVTATNQVGTSVPSAASSPVTPVAVPPPTNLLPDPGFEVGNGGWAPFIVGSLTRVGSPTHGGSFALQVAAVSAGVNYVGLTQNSVVSRSVAGTTYTASCWVQPTRGTLNVQFRFLEYTQNWGSYIPVSTTTVNNVPTGSWTLVQVSGKAVNSGERMIPQIYSTNQTTNTGAMLYDDCSVSASP
jgi:aryl-phospho-beta-D-glucosidase BglC (GH1 family)